MHRVGRDGLAVFDFGSYGVDVEDDLGFVFGEIDIRVHVGAQRDKHSRDPVAVITELAQNYMAVLSEVHERFPKAKIYVISCVPPAGRDYPLFDGSYPRNGSDEDRAGWTVELNSQLKALSLLKNFIYVDQYSPFCNSKGLLDLEISWDGVHIDSRFIERVNLPRVCTDLAVSG